MDDTRKWTKEEVKELLERSDKAVIRGLLAIYSKQTADERRVGTTRVRNSVGFSGVDSEFLSSLAEQAKVKGTLTKNQMEKARQRLMKYAGQLAKISNGEL